MIDRLWYEWQQNDPQNANSFSGGSTQCLDSLAEYQQFPSGCSPDLYVSACNSRLRSPFRFACIAELDLTDGRVISATHHRRRNQHNRRRSVLCIPVKEGVHRSDSRAVRVSDVCFPHYDANLMIPGFHAKKSFHSFICRRSFNRFKTETSNS
jgi:hypothetical protein